MGLVMGLVMGHVVSLGLHHGICFRRCRRCGVLGRSLWSGLLSQYRTRKSHTRNEQGSDRKFTHHGIEPRVMEVIANPAGTRQLGKRDAVTLASQPAYQS